MNQKQKQKQKQKQSEANSYLMILVNECAQFCDNH